MHGVDISVRLRVVCGYWYVRTYICACMLRMCTYVFYVHLCVCVHVCVCLSVCVQSVINLVSVLVYDLLCMYVHVHL